MDLGAFQRRLSEQFARLRDLRASENYPVYAIEHGLTAEESSAAQVLLNESFRSKMRADRTHWLVWIAIAAEVGYGYDGSEYWDSFGAAFPSWSRYGDRNRDRNQIREWFKTFAKHYRGLTPSGPWARQFPIIAWPITQAILPRYLQRQFSDHLFDLRLELSRGEELTLDEIGDLLASRYYGSSSRFEGFLQEKALTARIVLALGQEGIEDAVAPMEKETFDRIIGDIDKLGSFGTRLRETRRVLRNARFINSAKPGFVITPKRSSEAHETTERPERPRLVARLLDEDTWTLSLALPDLAGLLRLAGLSPRDLEQARMRFRLYGEGNSWSPARGLFFYNGEHEEPLPAYPAKDVHVFEFERPLPATQTILRHCLHFPSQVIRLLRVRADGAAFELSGLHVRANHAYLLATVTPIDSALAQKLGLVPLRSRSSSVHLCRLDVPSTLDDARIAALRALGLGYQLGVRAEPLGLSPRWAISDGALVFLDTEIPMFCVTSEVAVREYLIGIDGQPPVRVTPASTGVALVSLGALSVGAHRVAISAAGAASGGNLVAEDLGLEIRPASPWRQAIEGKAGVSLSLNPRGAPIEQLIDKAARLHMTAPPRRTVALTARFFGVDGTLFHEETIGRPQTPLSDDRLSQLVAQKLTAESQLQHLERAARIEVRVALDECSSGHVTFEKEAEPLRWIRVDDKKIRLADDTADQPPPTIERFDLDSVDAGLAADYEQSLAGIELRGKGGLFVATFNGRQYEVIATAVQRQLSGFSGLGVPARISATSGNPLALIGALLRWHSARRLIGPMAFIARDNAVHALERALAASLCGEDWVAATDRVRSGKQKLGDLYACVFYSRGFASGIANFSWRYDADEAAAITEYSRLLNVYRIPVDSALASHALRLAFQPHTFDPTKPQSAELFDALRGAEPVVRGAYFARLATDLARASRAAALGAIG